MRANASRDRERPGSAKSRGSQGLSLARQPRRRRECSLEVPVVVFGGHGLADDVAGAGPREEVVVLVGVRRERRQDRRVHVRDRRREHGLVAEVHERLVGVVVQELLDVLGQADRVVEILRVLNLVLVQLEEQVERVVLQLIARGLGRPSRAPSGTCIRCSSRARPRHE